MLVHWFLAAIHLLAFAMGFWAVLTRGTAFSRLASGSGDVGRVLLADNLWGAFGVGVAHHRRHARLRRL